MGDVLLPPSIVVPSQASVLAGDDLLKDGE
jgi:hypothetical protein